MRIQTIHGFPQEPFWLEKQVFPTTLVRALFHLGKGKKRKGKKEKIQMLLSWVDWKGSTLTEHKSLDLYL